MQPNNYQAPNNPSNEEWFNGASPAVIDSQSTLPSKQPSFFSRHARKLLIIGPLVALTGSIGVALLIWVLTPLCLTAEDYRELTGLNAETQLSPKDSFYTTSFTSIDTLESADSRKIAKIASFYKANKGDRSVVISLSNGYIDSTDLANSNLATLQSMLIKAGIDKSAIEIQTPNKISENDVADEGLELAQELTQITYLTIKSDDGCRQ